MPAYPVIYSFRRCPYAIRARMALAKSAIRCELREVVLASKPLEMLALSAKGTVPVLQLPDGRLMDESFEIMLWAMTQHDPGRWLAIDIEELRLLVWQNDHDFKPLLDRYKYFSRYPEHPREHYRLQAEAWLQCLDRRLQQQAYIYSGELTLADVALFPFIRQFARADLVWFQNCRYSHLRNWMASLEQSVEFTAVMQKHKPWVSGTDGVLI